MHLNQGAKRVILSAPSDDDMPMWVRGVNDSAFNWLEESIISCASCTTNNAAPMIQVIQEQLGIESAYISTIHSYTGDQRLHDAPHKDLRRARGAVQSIVPTTTGAAKALTRVFPNLGERLGGCGIRVPVPNGSLSDITFMVAKNTTVDEVNAWFKSYAQQFPTIMEYSEEPLVSRDILGNKHSCVFDSELTSVIGRMVKIVGWYDNEVGYSNRLKDAALFYAVHR
jgi:glyceraldehyde 3-phosphate dehydrogenase